MINLLPQEIKEATKFARRNVILLQYCVVVLAVAFTLSAMLLFGITILNADEQEIQQSLLEDQTTLNTLASTNDEAKVITENLAKVSSVLNREIKFSELLTEIGAVMPRGATLSGLALTEDIDAPLALDVSAVSAETIGVLQKNLAESEIFSSADTKSIIGVYEGENDTPTSFTGSLTAYFAKKTPEPVPVSKSTTNSTTDSAASPTGLDNPENPNVEQNVINPFDSGDSEGAN